MKKRCLACCCGIVLAAALTAAIAVPLSPKVLIGWSRGEPCFRGLPASYWIPCSGSPNQDTWRISSERDVAVMPVLIFAVGHTDDRTRAQVVRCFYRYQSSFRSNFQATVTSVPALTALLQDERWRVRRSAAEILRIMGPAAESAVPALLDMLHAEYPAAEGGEACRWEAATALQSIGSQAQAAGFAILMRELKGSDTPVRESAAHLLWVLGSKADLPIILD